MKWISAGAVKIRIVSVEWSILVSHYNWVVT